MMVRGSGTVWGLSTSTYESHRKAHESFSSLYRVIGKQPDLCNLAEVLEPSLSLLSFVNWIFSGDTRIVYTEILDSQIFLINNYFQYFVPKVLHRGPLAGNSMIKALSWERERKKRVFGKI